MKWAFLALNLLGCDPFTAYVEEKSLCIKQDIALPGLDVDTEVTLDYNIPFHLNIPIENTQYESEVYFKSLDAEPLEGVTNFNFIHNIEISIRSGTQPYLAVAEGTKLPVKGLHTDISNYIFNNYASLSAQITGIPPKDDWSAELDICFSVKLTFH